MNCDIFRSLQFSDLMKENDFAKSRMPSLVRSLRLGSMVLFAVTSLGTLSSALSISYVAESVRAPAMFVLIVNSVTLILCLSMVLFLRVHAPIVLDDDAMVVKTTLSPEAIEKIAVVASLFVVFTTNATNSFRVARLFGLDPVTAWDTYECDFTDSIFALSLDTIVTAVAVFLPIRMNLLPAVPVMALLSFILTSVFLGSPETISSQAMISVQLMALGYLVLMGCRMTEARERGRFEETFKARQEMVTERVARFGLEHQMEQNSTHSQQAPVTTVYGSSIFSDSLQYSSAETTSHVSITTGMAATRIPEDRSEIFTLLSQSESPETKHGREIGTQTEFISCQDKSTDPLLVWSKDADGWKCSRCSKPPLPPTTISGDEDAQLAQDRCNQVDLTRVRHKEKKRRRGDRSPSGSQSSSPSLTSSLTSSSGRDFDMQLTRKMHYENFMSSFQSQVVHNDLPGTLVSGDGHSISSATLEGRSHEHAESVSAAITSI
eukprot:gnl/MRDRNA2_/MRDRNA2_155140_c0_seq1.p1 gnl/MRDRNA2_/MRDRNA2_155140_c0~~gnl/MRDRNA2_/MRDRNA2_155140_c0_seq1.p1  ORF type:complete len:492 (-),score=64.56 gnl/MRDRNA2_/MRDRNA2_155140_c0_seq1:240-1715(-)